MTTKPLTPQAQTIWDILKTGRTITPLIAMTTLGISSLTSRISEIRRNAEVQESLEANGQVLFAAFADDLNGRRYKEYYLRDKEVEA